MAEIRVGEGVKYRNSLLDEHASMKVAVWDVGPFRPTKPAKLVPPKVAPGSIEHDIAQIEMREAVSNYEKELTDYIAQLKDFDAWHARHSGPVILEQWSCDARDTFAHDGKAVAEGRQPKRRYYRFDAKAPRQGLPVGIEPGAGHAAQLERQAADAAALEQARRNDPYFGGQS